MPTTIAAIDPGVTGAIAVLRGKHVLECHHLPTVQINKSTYVDAGKLAGILARHRVEHIFCEFVNAMPARASNGGRRRVGAQSMFNFGRSVGVIDGIAGTLGIPISFITPASWKRTVGLIGADKDSSRTRARQLFPSEKLPLKKDHGKADALLIGYAGQLKSGVDYAK